MKIKRFDQGEIRNARIMEDGRLMADVIVSRIGVLTYVKEDGSLRRELRHPNEVLNQRSLDTLKMIPITLGHPVGGIVNAQNSKDLQVGQTGENVRGDSPFIKSSITVNQQKAIDNIIAGNQELSLGYYLELDETPGEWDGERYDAVQRNVTYNHLAIVPQARAGREARITLDSADAVQTNNQKEPVMDTNLLIVNLDGIEYKASPEVKKSHEKLTTNVDSLTAELKTTKESNSKLQANFDSQKEEIEKLKAVNLDAKIQEGVQSRLKLEREATPHMDQADVSKIAEMTEQQIKTAVIMKKFPKANLDGKDLVYITARYDSALEMEVAQENNILDQGKKLNGDVKTIQVVVNADASQKTYKERTLNAYKGENK